MSVFAPFGVIFDMDGVLLPSEKYNFASYNLFLKEKGIELGENDIKHFLGRTLAQMLTELSEKHGVPLDHYDFSHKTGEIQLALMEKEGITATAPLRLLLAMLKEKEIPLAVGTSSTRWRAERFLSFLGISEYFPVLVAAEDVSRHKPEPDVFLEAAKRMGVEPSRCLVIEDAPSGIEAAKRAGMKVVGFYGHHGEPSGLHQADSVIGSFAEIDTTTIETLFGRSHV